MDLLNKKSIWALLIGSALLATTACKKDDDIVTPEPTSPTAFTITDIGNNTNKVEGAASSDFTFTNDKQWLLQGFVYVNDGATLTVDPGTVIRGDKNSKGTLIIRRGAKIHAVGNSAQPIVFTLSLIHISEPTRPY